MQDSNDVEEMYFTARHLLELLKGMDEHRLDMPLILVHGKGLHKPNLIHGFIPAPVPVDGTAVQAKAPALLALGQLTELA
jgi:hypothetical protein